MTRPSLPPDGSKEPPPQDPLLRHAFEVGVRDGQHNVRYVRPPFEGAQGDAWSRGYEVGARQKTEPAPPTEPLPAPPAQPAPPFSAAPILLGLACGVLGGLLLFAVLQRKRRP